MTTPRIFLSYARLDLDHARALRTAIEAELGAGTVWHDVRNLAGDHWWTEIEDTIRDQASVEHLVLVASAQSLAPARRVVRDEWRLAQREGKTVTNVFWSARPGFAPPAFGTLPAWIRAKSMLDLSLPDRMQALTDTLKQPGQGARRPFMAPPLPEGFVQRSIEFAQLKSALLDAQGDAIGITAALRGAGGFGKTVLATALARDEDIQDAFHDGILWVTLGERPSLAQIISDLITVIGRQRAAFTEVSIAANRLKELLDRRRCLLVIDDAWQRWHLRPFLDGAPSITRLVTTRRDDIFVAGTTKVIVDAMQGAEAIEMLTYRLGEIGTADKIKLAKLGAERLGEWPILLSLVNGFLRARVDRGEPLPQAIRHVTERLDRRGINAFNRALENERTAAIDSTVGASLDFLAEFDQGRPAGFHAQRFHELAVFPEDAEIPIATIARLWGRIGDVDDLATEELLERFYGLALLQVLDLKRRTVRLHDVMRTYLGERAKEAMPALHEHVVSAYGDKCGPDIEDTAERSYFYEHYVSHLAEAGEVEIVDALLLDPQWMERKLRNTSTVLSLAEDYKRFGRTPSHTLVGQTVRLASSILQRSSQQLQTQLLARLSQVNEHAIVEFLKRVRDLIAPPAILPIGCCMTPPGVEIARFECSHMVLAVAAVTDDVVALGTWEGKIEIWNYISDAQTASFECPATFFISLTLLPSGEIATGSDDNTVRIWDLATGRQAACFTGHTRAINALAALPGGLLASGSNDHTVRVWDLATGRQAACFTGHTGPINALAALPGGLLASGSNDHTVRVWDLATGHQTVCFTGHTAPVNALAALPGGLLASGSGFSLSPSGESTLRLWDLASGHQTSCFAGHTGRVTTLAALPGGLLASGSDDRTVRVWDLVSGRQTACFTGHTASVTALTPLPGGLIASGSSDRTLRVWDPRADFQVGRFKAHDGRISALTILRDGRVASGGRDGIIRLWDASTGSELTSLKGHTDFVQDLSITPDGRLASSSWDATIRLWDPDTGEETARLIGHSKSGIPALAALPSGLIVSAGGDDTVRVWDSNDGREISRFAMQVHHMAVLSNGFLALAFGNSSVGLLSVTTGSVTNLSNGHKEPLRVLEAFPDGQLASGSNDRTIRLWDPVACRESGRFEGHQRAVISATYVGGDRMVSSSLDQTIRLWSITTRECLHCIELDAPINCLAPVCCDDRKDSIVVGGDDLGHILWFRILD